jgi:hypothetical protein
MLLGNSNLWLNLREIQINSVLLIGQLELFITKNRLYPVLFFKRCCFQLSPRKTHCKFDPRVLGHPVFVSLRHVFNLNLNCQMQHSVIGDNFKSQCSKRDL